MSSCCTPTGGCSTTTPAVNDVCPVCETKGVAVDPITLKALLTPLGLRRGVPPNPRYCASAQCDTVYFDNGAGVVFSQKDVTVPVHAKHPDNETVPVCYCFAHTPQTIRNEIESLGTSTATASITAEVKAGRCACEVKNPKGSCCLGDVARVERRIASTLTAATS